MTTTLLDIYSIRFNASDLRKRILAAVGVVASAILEEDPETKSHADRLTWAQTAIANIYNVENQVLWHYAVDDDMASQGDSVSDFDIIAFIKANATLFATT